MISEAHECRLPISMAQGVVLESGAAEVVICGLFCVMAIVTSSVHVWSQLSAFSNPEHQTHIVRILIMVPIYAMGGWFALLFRDEEIYFDTIKAMSLPLQNPWHPRLLHTNPLHRVQ